MTSSTHNLLRAVSIASIAIWLLYTAYCILEPSNPIAKYNWYVITISLVAFGLAHGARRFGWSAIVGMFVIASVIATISEYFSITAGFPFGYYVHTPAMGPQIFQVPIIIGPVYFGMTYVVWTLVEMTLGESAASRRPASLIGAPLVAALVMPGFDMCFDPIGSTVGKYWLYRESGGYFGVPLQNYIGWFINGWAIFQSYALFLSVRRVNMASATPAYWYEASLFWGLMGLQYTALLLATPGSMVVHDSGGWAWRSRDILQNAAMTGFYTMVAAALISALVVRIRTRGPAT
jgi:putative membrane protein